MSVSQEGMLWHEQLTPGSFNLPCLVRRYEGPLDVAALEWALSELVRRHEPLRTTFDVAGGAAVQIVHDAGDFVLVTVDLGGLEARDRDDEVARLLADATGRPFDLATGPLFEPRLVRFGPDDHLLVIRLHHTVFDDWSVDVFRRELSALYSAGLEGASSPLPEPATTFAEFTRRQAAMLAGEGGEAQRSWWRRELDGAPLSVQLSIAGLRGPNAMAGSRRAGGDDGPGEPLRLDLPPLLAAELRALTPRLRATPFMVVLAAFSVLVARATELEDLVLATVVAHRNASDLEPLIGCFTKKVPLRLRLAGDPRFDELVARTRASLLGALAHQDVAFEAAVQEALGTPAAEHGVVPQMAVVFQGETPRQVKLAIPGVSSGPFEVPGDARKERHFSAARDGAGNVDLPVWGDGIYLGTFLILSFLERPGGMSLVARGVFDRPSCRRLLEDFQALLERVAAAPTAALSDLAAVESDPSPDVVELRGFQARRSRLEAALRGCPGVSEAAVVVRLDPGLDPRLVAYVVPDRETRPTLAELRVAFWADLPGAPWPAARVIVDALPRLPNGALDVDALPPPDPHGADQGCDAGAAELVSRWRRLSGRPVGSASSYWQDFSFLPVLAEAREAGMAIPDEMVARCRTPETLAAALAATRAR